MVEIFKMLSADYILYFKTFSASILQVFAVRSGGTMGVVVKGPYDKNMISFRYVCFM